MRPHLLACTLALTLIATPAPSAAAHAVTGPVPVGAAPTVTGPVLAGDQPRDHPFFATDQDLTKAGYVEQEYFIEGTASRYTTPDQATGAVIDSGHPYKTRIVVRRPISPKKFNGTAIVEWYGRRRTDPH